MNILRKIIDFYLYSSIHIALGAGLSVILCYSAFVHIPTSDYPLFVFSSTLFLYCAHRIVGINKVRKFQKEGRFAVIKKFRKHLILYALLAAVGSIYFFYTLPLALKIILLIPALISLLYIAPIFPNKRRLRDFHHIKIFLIALSWSLTIGLIPYLEAHEKIDLNGILYSMDKFCFIFAITLPFDVRDLLVDRANNVSTIPSKIGAKRSYQLAYLLLFLSMIIVATLMLVGFYTRIMGSGIILSYLITFILIHISRGKQDDYFYSGLLDGSIALVAIVGIGLSELMEIIF